MDPASKSARRKVRGTRQDQVAHGHAPCAAHRAHGRACHGLGRHDTEHDHSRRLAGQAGAHGEQGVAIGQGVGRVDAACQAVVAHQRQALGLRLGQRRVGGDHADGGVGAGQDRQRRFAAQQATARVAQAPPSAVRAPAISAPVSGSTISPSALQAISAPTVTPSSVTEAVPMPPFIA